MSTSLFRHSQNNTSIAASTTQYQSGVWEMVGNGITTESQAQNYYGTAGISSNIYMFVISNDRASSTLRFRKNTANGNQNISTTTTGMIIDVTNNDSMATSDIGNLSIVTGAGGTTFVKTAVGMQYTPTDITLALTKMWWGQSGVYNVALTSAFSALAGRGGTEGISGVGNESNVQGIWRTSGTLQNIFANVSAYTYATASTIRSRKNTANGNLVLTPSATGTSQDTVNSDTIVSGDLVNYSITTPVGANSMTLFMGIEFNTTNNTSQVQIGTSDAGGQSVAAGATNYQGVVNIGAIDATETNLYAPTNFATTFSNLYVFLVTNGMTTNGTLNFRKNTANGNQTKTLTALTTGYYEDTTNSDTVTTTDNICLQASGGATAGARYVQGGIKLNYSAITITLLNLLSLLGAG